MKEGCPKRPCQPTNQISTLPFFHGGTQGVASDTHSPHIILSFSSSTVHEIIGYYFPICFYFPPFPLLPSACLFLVCQVPGCHSSSQMPYQSRYISSRSEKAHGQFGVGDDLGRGAETAGETQWQWCTPRSYPLYPFQTTPEPPQTHTSKIAGIF